MNTQLQEGCTRNKDSGKGHLASRAEELNPLWSVGCWRAQPEHFHTPKSKKKEHVKRRILFLSAFLTIQSIFPHSLPVCGGFPRTYFTQRCSKQFVKHHYILKINDKNFSILTLQHRGREDQKNFTKFKVLEYLLIEPTTDTLCH